MADEFNKEMCDREHIHLKQEMNRIETDLTKDISALGKIVEKIRDRVSPTVVAILMAMSAFIGGLVTALGFALKH